MDLSLAGKRALITGGSKGIGRATAEVLAEEGVHLLLVARDAAVLADAEKAVRARRQVNVETMTADLSHESEVRRVAQHAGASTSSSTTPAQFRPERLRRWTTRPGAAPGT